MNKNNGKTPAKKFTPLLVKWNREKNTRQMPWKGEKDPYKIWLSEIILQQTRVDQGLAYYNRFVAAFPDIHKLAKAPEEKVFKLWEGLGYYTRCRNLIATARYISKELKGKFPADYESIRALKGVGPYTAAAISSFAFNLPHAVVDGNVFRVLARVFGVGLPLDTTEGKKYFTQLADELLDKDQPGSYNQAIMDFGAVICKPALPLCPTCVFNKTCVAFAEGRVNELPVKLKKTTIRKRWFYYFVIEHHNELVIQQRTAKDIWQQLYEFPLMETEKETDPETLLQQAIKNGLLPPGSKISSLSPLFKQQLSHQRIAGRFIQIRLTKKWLPAKNNLLVSRNKLNRYAFPQFINQYLRGQVSQVLF